MKGEDKQEIVNVLMTDMVDVTSVSSHNPVSLCFFNANDYLEEGLFVRFEQARDDGILFRNDGLPHWVWSVSVRKYGLDRSTNQRWI